MDLSFRGSLWKKQIGGFQGIEESEGMGTGAETSSLDSA